MGSGAAPDAATGGIGERRPDVASAASSSAIWAGRHQLAGLDGAAGDRAGDLRADGGEADVELGVGGGGLCPLRAGGRQFHLGACGGDLFVDGGGGVESAL